MVILISKKCFTARVNSRKSLIKNFVHLLYCKCKKWDFLRQDRPLSLVKSWSYEISFRARVRVGGFNARSVKPNGRPIVVLSKYQAEKERPKSLVSY